MCLLGFLLVRAPYYPQPIIGEEGIFADIFLAQPAGPKHFLLGKVAGQQIRGYFQHPTPPLEALRAAGALAGRLVSFDRLAASFQATVTRFVFSLFSFGALVLLLLSQAPRGPRDVLPLGALVTALLISPLAVSSSILLHIDGSVGMLTAALVGLALLAEVQERSSPRARAAMIAAAAFLFGLGKQEWSIVLAGTFGLALLYVLALRREDRALIAFLACGMAGLALGNAASYVFDPFNYAAGVRLIFSRSDSLQMIDFAEPGAGMYLALRLWIVAPLLMALAVAFGLFWRARTARSWLAFSFGLLLFLGFSPGLFTTSFAFRYYAPALAATVVAIAGLAPRPLGKKATAVFVAVAVVLAANFGLFFHVTTGGRLSVTEGMGQPLSAYFPQQDKIVAAARRQGCVPVLPAWTNYSHPAADFIIPSLGPVVARRLVEERGGTLCP
jgi:hypothetical protein